MTKAIWYGINTLKNSISIVLVFPLLSTSAGKEDIHHNE